MIPQVQVEYYNSEVEMDLIPVVEVDTKIGKKREFIFSLYEWLGPVTGGLKLRSGLAPARQVQQ